MRPPAKIRAWLTPAAMVKWVYAASAQPMLLRKRLAVWLTAAGPFYAARVAQFLGVAEVSVWRLVARYNRLGPQGLGPSRPRGAAPEALEAYKKTSPRLGGRPPCGYGPRRGAAWCCSLRMRRASGASAKGDAAAGHPPPNGRTRRVKSYVSTFTPWQPSVP